MLNECKLFLFFAERPDETLTEWLPPRNARWINLNRSLRFHFYWEKSLVLIYPKSVALKITRWPTVLTFGFRTPPPAIASFGGSLFSGGRYFRMAKTRTPHGYFKRQKSKKCERNTFWKKEMYILYFKTFFQKVFIKRVMNRTVKYNKSRISVAFNLFRIWDLFFRIYRKLITWSSLQRAYCI